MTPVVTDRLATEKNATGSGEFYPYGEPMSGSSDTYGTYKMSTRANAYYARNRWYDSAMGRFTTPDPYGGSASLTNPGSWNRYAYAGNDPVNFNDPSGLDGGAWIWMGPPVAPEPPPPNPLMAASNGAYWPQHLTGEERPEDPKQMARMSAASTTAPCENKLRAPLIISATAVREFFQEPSRNIGTVTLYEQLRSIAGSAYYYNTFGIQGTLPLSEAVGHSYLPDPTLSSYGKDASPANAFVVTGESRSIFLRASFYTESAKDQAITLLHELLHLAYGVRPTLKRSSCWVFHFLQIPIMLNSPPAERSATGWKRTAGDCHEATDTRIVALLPLCAPAQTVLWNDSRPGFLRRGIIIGENAFSEPELVRLSKHF